MTTARGAWTVAMWLLLEAAALAQPAIAPFTMMPRLEGFGTGSPPRPVPVTIVVTGDGAPDGAEILRLVPSGRRWPTWRIDAVSRVQAGQSSAVLQGLPGQRALLVLLDAQPGYRLDGPFHWPARQDVRNIDVRRRRTVLGSSPAGDQPASFAWVTGARLPDAGSWPACGMLTDTRWECIGVPWDEPGVLLLASGPPVRFAVTTVPEGEPVTSQIVAVRTSNWCRLLRVVSLAAPWEPLGTMTAEPMRARARARGRLAREPDDRVTVDPLSPDSFWVCGEAEPDGGVLHIEGGQVATTDLAYDGWHRGPAELSHEAMLEPAVNVTGRVEDAKGNPAPDAVVVVSRVVTPDPSDGQTVVPLPQFVVEVTSGTDGAFDVSGLRDDRYEFAALHPTLGRVTKTFDVGDGSIVLRLVPSKRVRGRVLRDQQPVSGVTVGLAPDLTSYVSGADPMELVSFSALTDERGRFDVTVPPAGAGVLRIGTSETAIVRVPLGPVDQLPAVTDVGDVELPSPVTLFVDVDQAAGCDLSAAGPFGSSGMTVVRGEAGAAGRYVFRLPEPGRWLLSLSCGGREVPVVPPIVEVLAGEREAYARATVRIGG